MRLYSFGNMYLQGIQAGIQCQHCTVELFNKYQHRSSGARGHLFDWAENHKTTILLNGGVSQDLEGHLEFLQRQEHIYPVAYFCESEEALDGALTNVSIILPEKIYMYHKWVEEYLKENPQSLRIKPRWLEREEILYKYTEWELELTELVRSKSLMN